MNIKSIENLINDAYQENGMIGACEEANKHKCVTYEYCNMCSCQVPIIKDDHICLCCGHETTSRDPDFEDIPLENDENN